MLTERAWPRKGTKRDPRKGAKVQGKTCH
jgi:hypothetical protein